MTENKSALDDLLVDCLFNYDLHEELSRCPDGVIYRATCKRGRLRNRCVAIKKIPRTSSKHTYTPSSTTAASIHSTLCHPSIVSLISSFNAPSGYCYVLELCSAGTLSELLESRESRALVEGELRGLVRTLIDGLVYLKKELVLHRDIKPSKIMITEDGRVKLSGFDTAVRLPTAESTVTEFCGSANYVSPEILSGRAYSFGTDLWSLGCVLVTCLSGVPAFNGADAEKIYHDICSAKYALPITVSPEAEDLTRMILQKNPRDRIPLHRIPYHAFFDRTFPTVSLKLSQVDRRDALPSRHATSECETRESRPHRRYPPLLSKDPVRARPGLYAKSKSRLVLNRAPLEDITNLYPEQPTDSPSDDRLRPPSRIVSVPAHSGLPPRQAIGVGTVLDSRPQTPALIVDSETPDLFEAENSSTGCCHSMLCSSDVPPSGSGRVSLHSSPRSQLRRVLSDSYSVTVSKRAVSLTSSRPVLYSRHTEAPKPRILSQATTTTAVSHPRSPTRAASAGEKKQSRLGYAAAAGNLDRPLLSTCRLKPQTHKVARGQLVILPSRSLLVDFREGERRRGGKGREVMVISPDGRTIQIHHAPHLSTPCCLVEPTATYDLAHLPQKYVKQYNDAACLVEQLKSRIPKLVHYADEAKCTLMANGPPGDVEIVIPAEDDRKDSNRDATRLRLNRKRCTLEISRYSAKTAKGRRDLGEWTKKIVALNPSLELAEEEKLALDEMEGIALKHLHQFLRVCSVVNVLGLEDRRSASKMGDDD
ncbi:kinase-like domain-containing protein [Trametes elegans]|nr:kinase-like domain-containing protein [Trametes elegans]